MSAPIMPSTGRVFTDSNASFTKLKSMRAIGKRVFFHPPIERVLFLERSVSILSGPAPLALTTEDWVLSLNFSSCFSPIKVVEAPVSKMNSPLMPLTLPIILK